MNDTAVALADESLTFPAMAGNVTVRTIGSADTGSGAGAAGSAGEAVRAIFAEVEAQCTRFDPASPLMRANAAGERWCSVPDRCFQAIEESARAYHRTAGRFDPRVARHLVALGYDHTLQFAGGPIQLPGHGDRPSRLDRPWRPAFDASPRSVRIGPDPIDLGGIGKGLALRWSADALRGLSGRVMIEAGGDCWLAGDGPSPPGWQVAVENPDGSDSPVAVLSLRDRACATSSVRVRSWTVGGRRVHHLIDPRTGNPGGHGLSAVTVVDRDPATAEVLSKALFLAGRDRIRSAVHAQGAAALWVTDTGSVQMSDGMRRHVIWPEAL